MTVLSILSDFIQNKMRMSHIYQPVMLMELLKRRGNRRDTDNVTHEADGGWFNGDGS